MINKSKIILISTAILIFTSVSAFAQTNRVYVADSGSDANLCTRAEQCRTITKALSVVDDGGEVIITESGDYDNFIVTKSVTVAAEPGVDAEIATTAASAVVIGVWPGPPIGLVTLRNLNLKHITSNFSPQGIVIYQSANLYVDGCTITGFVTGIADVKGGKLFVHESIFRNNSTGIQNLPDGILNTVIENSQFENNTMGIWVDAKTYATIRNCVISGSSQYGIYLVSNNRSARAEAVIDSCRLTGNKTALFVSGSSNEGTATARLSNSTISQNTTSGVSITTSGIVYSFQNNVISGNLKDVDLNPLTPVSLK